MLPEIYPQICMTCGSNFAKPWLHKTPIEFNSENVSYLGEIGFQMPQLIFETA